MGDLNQQDEGKAPKAGWFCTTHWSVVIEAAEASSPKAIEALEALCQAYWFPLYAYVRRKGYDVHAAQDLTQEFFARLLAQNKLKSVDRQRGKFRSFLLGTMEHFLANEWVKAHRKKRGGGCAVLSIDEVSTEGRYEREPGHDISPDKVFDRQWVVALLERTMDQLRLECTKTTKAELFDKVQGVLSGDKDGFSYGATASELNMTEGAMRTAVHRLRQRYGEILRTEIAQTVSSPEEVDEEIQHLFHSLED